MSRLIARAESWERVYTALENINFAAFDYMSVKQSLVDYLKTFYPEFNDMIETSELIAIIETFAYIAEQLAYRLDVNAHENFISVAQRRDSILRLAKLIAYKVDRPIPARGLVKITSVQTTETVTDSSGLNLANTQILWNDPTNDRWKEQFIAVMNRVMKQQFGTVQPTDKFQIQDTVFEVYSTNAQPSNGVFSYNAFVDGTSYPMELVPVAYGGEEGIIERRPDRSSTFSWLYAADGMGDISPTTGFMCLTKQGQLRRVSSYFDGITPNQTFDVTVNNINDSDVWINNVDPDTGEVINEQTSAKMSSRRSGEWEAVDLAHAQNIIFNTNPVRQKYEIETLNNNQIRVIFGDGDFADIPSGLFDIWFRTSVDADLPIPQSAVTNQTASFSYRDASNRLQTLTFQFSLIGSLLNASAAESTEHVRITAPSIYYTQDRMVNGEDYNVYPLKDSSILKLRTINRTFVGDSQYIQWHDPSQTYENVKVFGTDAAMYFIDTDIVVTSEPVNYDDLIDGYVQPLLSTTDIFTQLTSRGIPATDINKTFDAAERATIISALTPPPYPVSVRLYYNVVTNRWVAIKGSSSTSSIPNFATDYIPEPLIRIDQFGLVKNVYNVTRVSRRIIFHSPSTAFWTVNESSKVTDLTTLRGMRDAVTILKANPDNNRTSLMQRDWSFTVVGQETNTIGSDVGLRDVSKLSVVSVDENRDGFPDNTTLYNIINPSFLVPLQAVPFTIQLPTFYVSGMNNVRVYPETVVWNEVVTSGVGDAIQITNLAGATSVRVDMDEFVYFKRADETSQWVMQDTSAENIVSWLNDLSNVTKLWMRYSGRSGMNFLWSHTASMYELVDPAPTNIHDMFIITRPYFTQLRRWLADSSYPKPSLPTPLELRNSYGYLLKNKMASDTVVPVPGKIKLILGPKAQTELRAKIKVVKSDSRTMTDNQIKSKIVTEVRNFFDIASWEFGETFYFTELVSALHMSLKGEVNSIVLVPESPSHKFGDLFEVKAAEDEILYADFNIEQVEVVSSLNQLTLNPTK